MKDLLAKRQEAGNYKEGSSSAFVVGDAYRDGPEGVTELIWSGDPAYALLIAVNLMLDAAKKMNISEGRVTYLISSIKEELQKANTESCVQPEETCI